MVASTNRTPKLSPKMALANKREDNKKKRADQKYRLQMQELKNEEARISAEYDYKIAKIRLSETIAKCDKEKEIAKINAEKEEKISAINAKVQIAEMEYRKYIADVFEKCIDRYVASVEVLEKEQTKRLQLILKFFQEENEKFLMEYNNDISKYQSLLEFYTNEARGAKGKVRVYLFDMMDQMQSKLIESQNQKGDYIRNYDKSMVERLKNAKEIAQANLPNLQQLISASKDDLLLLDSE